MMMMVMVMIVLYDLYDLVMQCMTSVSIGCLGKKLIISFMTDDPVIMNACYYDGEDYDDNDGDDSFI